MNVRPKKYLGQNFLFDRNIQKKIVKSCDITPQDTVLEIGAGRGELTRLIAEKTKNLFAVEKDTVLYSILKSNLEKFPYVKIINQDILQFNILDFFKSGSKIKVIGNIPYNITTPIITHLLESRTGIKEAFLTVQKEFAKRMTALKGGADWGAFSCFLQYYSYPKKTFSIKKTCFWPQPKVDSTLIKLSIKTDLPLDNKKEERLFTIIRLGFQQRRKTLKNALKGIVSDKILIRYFNQFNFNNNVRAEELSVNDFINLVNTEQFQA